MIYLTLWFLLAAQLLNAAPAGDLPRYEPGVLYLPDKAIALGKLFLYYFKTSITHI